MSLQDKLTVKKDSIITSLTDYCANLGLLTDDKLDSRAVIELDDVNDTASDYFSIIEKYCSIFAIASAFLLVLFLLISAVYPNCTTYIFWVSTGLFSLVVLPVISNYFSQYTVYRWALYKTNRIERDYINSTELLKRVIKPPAPTDDNDDK